MARKFNAPRLFGNFAATTAVPTNAFKVSMTNASQRLAEQARSLPVNMLDPVIAESSALLAGVNAHQTWDENQTVYCGIAFADPCWANKTTVKQNLQIAYDTARTRKAAASGQPPPANAPLANQAPVQTVNIGRETIAQTPTAIVERATEIVTPTPAPTGPTRGPSGKPIASKDVKGALSSQVKELKASNKGPTTRSTTLSQRSQTVLADLNQYEPWTDSSWFGPAYETWQTLRTDLYALIADNRPLATTPGAPAPALPPAPAPPPPIVQGQGAQPRTQPVSNQTQPSPTATPTPPAAPSGPNFTDMAAGISSILNPLATAGAGIFQSQQQANLARLQLRQQAPAAPQVPMYMPIPSGGNNTLLIAGVVGGAVLLLLIVVLATR